METPKVAGRLPTPSVSSIPEVAVVAYGEIGVKSTGVRARMSERLARNLRAALAARDVDGDVERRWSRLFVHAPDPEAAARVASDVFGVVHATPAAECAASIDDISAVARDLATDHDSETSYAVRVTRAGDRERHEFTSQSLERDVGAVVGEATDAPVDLDDPDRTYRIEVRNDRAYVGTDRYRGPGGLPVGTQGAAVVLFSGGIDSPVAAWELAKRGVRPVPLYVDLGEFGGPDHRARAVETCRQVGRYVAGYDTRLRVVDAGDLVADLSTAVDATRMLSLRRMMLAAAATVAAAEGAHSIATGEALGQKSSQTGENVQTTDAAVDYPVHRPLLTDDKDQITARAREIGTFTDATMNVGCERVAPSHPQTRASLGEVEAAEPDDLLARAEKVAGDYTIVDAADEAGPEFLPDAD